MNYSVTIVKQSGKKFSQRDCWEFKRSSFNERWNKPNNVQKGNTNKSIRICSNKAVAYFCAPQFKIPWKQAFHLIPCCAVCVFQRRGVSSVPCGSVQGARESRLPKRH